LLNRLLKLLGIERNDVIIGNALLCGPITDIDKERPEFRDALVRCRARREEEGDLGDARVILAAGSSAAEGVVGSPIILGGRQPRRGALHFDPYGRSVFPTWHPAALLRAGGDSSKKGKKAGGGLSDAEVETLGFDLERSWQYAYGQRQAFKPQVIVTDRPGTFTGWIAANAVRASRVGIDVETDSVDPTTAGLLSVGLAVQTSKGEVRAISFWWPNADESAKAALRELLLREDLEGVLQNCQFDLSVLERHVVPPRNKVFDTMLAAHAAFPECKLDLGSLAHTYLVVPPWKFLFREWERKNKKQVETKSAEWIRRLSEYNAMDVATTIAIRDPIYKECEKRNVTQIIDLDVRQALVARKMTERGLYVSHERRAELRENFVEHEKKALAKLERMVVEAVMQSLEVGMHVPEIQKLLGEIQKSSNKGLPKPRFKKPAKPKKGRRKKKLALGQPEQLVLAAAATTASMAAVDLVTKVPPGTLPQSSSPPVLEGTIGSPSAPTSHLEAPAGTSLAEAKAIGWQSIDWKAIDWKTVEWRMIDWLRSAPAGASLGAEGTWIYPPPPDKVWKNKAWNPLSTTQLRLAFDICGVQLPANALTKSGQRSLNKQALVQAFDHPLVGATIETRKYRRLLSNYFESEGARLAEDSRIRVGWKVHGTPTGRWSSGAGGGGVGDIGIAVQNWPPIMRKMIVAPLGYLLVGADYSALELRMIALLSGEKVLLDVFNDSTGSRDLHSENAARLYGDTWTACDPTRVVDPIHGGRLDAKQVKAATKKHDKGATAAQIAEDLGWSEQGIVMVLDFAGRRVLIRKFTKTGIYAAVYGAVPPTVQSQLRAQSLKETDPRFARMLREISIKQCQTFVDAVPRFWPRLARWRDEQISIRSKTGVWISPIDGRRRVWPMGRVDPTQCVNTSVQGTSGSLMNQRMLMLMPLLPPDVHLILQVHDSLTFEAPEAIANDVKKLVEDTMTTTLEIGGYKCLFTVEAAVGKSWDVV
jgi:DNA polymerase I-like protein with 3'-5' exonuclease and polymerase domains